MRQLCLSSQPPVLVSGVLLLYRFQAPLGLGVSVPAASPAQPARQARQLDLLHVLQGFALGVLQEVPLALRMHRQTGGTVRGRVHQQPRSEPPCEPRPRGQGLQPRSQPGARPSGDGGGQCSGQAEQDSPAPDTPVATAACPLRAPRPGLPTPPSQHRRCPQPGPRSSRGRPTRTPASSPAPRRIHLDHHVWGLWGARETRGAKKSCFFCVFPGRVQVRWLTGCQPNLSLPGKTRHMKFVWRSWCSETPKWIFMQYWYLKRREATRFWC